MRLFHEIVFATLVASFTEDVNPRLAKRTLKTNGRLANRWLTSLVKEATDIYIYLYLFFCSEMPRIQMDPHYTRTPNGELGITWELIRGMTSPMSSLHIDYTIAKNDDVLYSDQMMLHEIFPRNASDKLANFGDIYFHGCNKGQVYKTTVTAFDEIGPIKGSTETFVFGCPLRLVSDVIVDDFDVHFNGTTTAEEVDTPVLRHDILLAISVGEYTWRLLGTGLYYSALNDITTVLTHVSRAKMDDIFQKTFSNVFFEWKLLYLEYNLSELCFKRPNW